MSSSHSAKRSRAAATAEQDASDSDQSIESVNEESNGSVGNEMQRRIARKLVRHSLAMEFRQEPLRWKQLTSKLSLRSKQLQPIFILAQEYLSDIFGLELEELPFKSENRRNGKTKESNSSSVKAYSLVNKLPIRMLEQQVSLGQVLQIHRDERVHLGLAAFITGLILLSGQAVASKELQAMCRRVGISDSEPKGGFERIILRLTRLQYIENVKSNILEADGTFQSDYRIGPRGKIQMFDKAIFAMIRKVQYKW